jgi:D-3-phosphoglycerate dehydrogenase
MDKTLKVLVATEKPFADSAARGIKDIFEKEGIQTAMLEKYTATEDLLSAVADVDGLIVRSDKVTSNVIEAAQRLKIVVRAGAGYDNIDMSACTQRSIVAMNTPGQNSNAVAELAIGMMIYMLRNAFTQGTGSELKGKTLGIHGYGAVGSRVAALGKAFGMDVLGYDAYSKPDVMRNDGVLPAANPEELYSKSDIVSIHIPATEQNKKSVNAALVKRMPAKGLLINTARKEVVDEAELLAIMRERGGLCYATDVMPSMHTEMKAALGIRYFSTEKKMGAETTEANVNAGLAAARQIVNFFKNGDRTFQINKQ